MAADNSRPGATRVLALTAVIEAGIGVAWVIWPAKVVAMLFATEIDPPGIAVCRVAGVALIALGVACLPAPASVWPLRATLIYSGLVTAYFLHIGVYHTMNHNFVSPLLWAAIALHAIMAIACAKCLLVWKPAAAK